MIFALLAKAVAILVQVALVEDWKVDFQRLLSKFWLNKLSKLSLGLQISLHEPFKQLIGGKQSKS